MRERERERERVNKVKCTGGTVYGDRDVRTCVRIRNTVHDWWEPMRNERGVNNFKLHGGRP